MGIALGIVLVVLEAPLATTAGVIFLILDILGLIPALRFTWLSEA